MGYYMRYIMTDSRNITLAAIEDGLKRIDPFYTIARDAEEDDEGELRYSSDIYGQFEINRPGDGLFEEELEEMAEDVEATEETNRGRVLGTLRGAKAIIALRVLWQGRDVEPTLSRIDPLWEWLFANREGLMQADGEGYYDNSGLILSI